VNQEKSFDDKIDDSQSYSLSSNILLFFMIWSSFLSRLFISPFSFLPASFIPQPKHHVNNKKPTGQKEVAGGFFVVAYKLGEAARLSIVINPYDDLRKSQIRIISSSRYGRMRGGAFAISCLRF
jgi:hypothetical protein